MSTRARTAWTAEQVRELGLTTDLPTAAAVLGIGKNKAYELAKAGDLPFPTLTLGRRIRVPVAALLRALGEAA